MVGPRTHATATLASNGPEGTADETGALAPLRDWDWDKLTLESGTRDTYVTLRWWIGPSWSGTLGTSGWLSASALNSIQKAAYLEAREACTPSLHRTNNQIPSSQFMLLLRCEWMQPTVQTVDWRSFYVGQSAESDLTIKIAVTHV